MIYTRFECSLIIFTRFECSFVVFTRFECSFSVLFRRAFSFKALGLLEEAADDFEGAKEFDPEDARLVINYR